MTGTRPPQPNPAEQVSPLREDRRPASVSSTNPKLTPGSPSANLSTRPSASASKPRPASEEPRYARWTERPRRTVVSNGVPAAA